MNYSAFLLAICFITSLKNKRVHWVIYGPQNKYCPQHEILWAAEIDPYQIDFGKTDLKKYLSIFNLKNFAQKLALKVLISKKRSSLWFWVVNCSQLALETLFVHIQTAWITNCDWSTQLLRNEPSCKKGCTSLLQNTHVKSISYIKWINIKQLLKLFLKSSFCFVFVYFPNALSDSLFVSFTFFCLCLTVYSFHLLSFVYVCYHQLSLQFPRNCIHVFRYFLLLPTNRKSISVLFSPILLDSSDQVHKFPHVGKFMHLGSGYFTLPSSVHCPVHLHTRPAPQCTLPFF